MNLVDALLGEHGVFYALFAHLEGRLKKGGSPAEIQEAAAVLVATLISHAKIEEELLFPALEQHLGPAGPLSVMRGEHEQIDGVLDEVAGGRQSGDGATALLHALQVARDHFAKEEQVLFQMARQALDTNLLVELGSQWAERRGVALG